MPGGASSRGPPVRMIPATYTGSQSRAEELFFADLLDSNYSATALHSLRLSRHVRSATSEADFVVVGERGVLVVEVKGGGVSRGEDGVWIYSGRNGIHRNAKGPFVQAEEAMWSLRELVLDKLPRGAGRDLTFGWAVAFPQCDFDVDAAEWDATQVFDSATRRRTGVTRWLRAVQDYWMSKTGGRPAPASSVEAVLKVMRPVFHHVPSLAARIDEAERQCFRFTEEQCNRFALIEHIDRTVCTGGAGTGKTFLAVELARQHLAEGSSVAFLVPNDALAAFVRSQPGMEAASVAVVGDDRGGIQPHDVLIADEAQDFMDFPGIDALDRWVNGGMEEGRWRIFLDPNAQAGIAGRFDPEAYEYVRRTANVDPRLVVNCRNTQQVVKHVGYFTGVDIGTPTFADGPGVDVVQVSDSDDEAEKLLAYLQRLQGDNIKDGAITILSPKPRDESCVARLQPRWQRRIHQLTPEIAGSWPPESITFASPLEFKGLENMFVCVVDLEEVDGNEAAVATTYVAMTRARAALWMAAPPAVERRLAELARARLLAGEEESDD